MFKQEHAGLTIIFFRRFFCLVGVFLPVLILDLHCLFFFDIFLIGTWSRYWIYKLESCFLILFAYHLFSGHQKAQAYEIQLSIYCMPFLPKMSLCITICYFSSFLLKPLAKFFTEVHSLINKNRCTRTDLSKPRGLFSFFNIAWIPAISLCNWFTFIFLKRSGILEEWDSASCYFCFVFLFFWKQALLEEWGPKSNMSAPSHLLEDTS